MKSSLRWRVPTIILCVLASALVCFGQEFRASLTGHVSDPAGAVLTGATVRVKNQQTGQETTATTTEDGNYTVPSLLPGTYTVTVEAQGFKSAVTENLELHVNDKASLDVKLEVGAVGDVVTVNAEDTPLLERDTATRGQVIENRRIQELPLNGRNPIMLATLAPGVQFNGNPQFTRPFDNGDNAQFSINGGVQRHNEFLLDGAPNNAVTDADNARTRSSNNIAYVPPVDATQEFKVQTNSYDASFGRTGGGVINVSTKAGGNQFHGTLYEFARRYQWEANDPASKAAGRDGRFARDPVTRENLGGRLLDQYGGNLGGPLHFPRFGEGGPALYDATDKVFFFVAYERYRESIPAPRTVNVPTLLERRGDFSQSGITIYDPLTTRPNPNGSGFIRDPFPGNVIPQERLNPVGFAVANAFPSPNTGAAGARTNNFINSPNLESEKFYNFVLRGDANIATNHHLFARYVRNKRNQFSGFDYPGLGRDAQDPLVRANNGVAVDLVSTLTPSTVMNVRATYTRFVQAAFRRTAEGFDATSIGFPASFSNARPVAIVPRFELEQFSAFGPRNPSQNTTNTIALQGNVSMVRGSHTIRVGGEVRDNRINARGASFAWGGGQFAFNRNFTQLDPTQPASGTQGSALASLLLGYPSGGVIEDLSRPGFRWRYYAPWIQDDIRLSRRLTLTLGLRYDYEAAPVERFNQQNRGFGFDQTSPLQAQIAGRAGVSECPACTNLRGGLLFAGVGGQPEEAFNADRNNFQPRVGVAFELNEKTVLRGGYGLYYFPQAEFGGTTGFTIQTPFVSTTGGGAQAFIPATTLSNPFPAGVRRPVGSSLGLLTQAGGAVIFSNPDREIPKIHQFSVGVQRQLPGGFRADIAYVGSRSVDILTNDFNIGNARNINVLTAAQLERCRVDSAFCNASVPNPFAGLLPGTGLNGATVQRRQLLLPFPQFTSVTMALENIGKVWYDSLQASVERRTASGLTMIGSYTFSRTEGALGFLNPQDAAPGRAPTDFDRPHVFVLSGVYQLPFGRDRRFFSDAGKGLNLLLGGWEYTFIARFQSGRPLNLPDNVDLIGDPVIEGNTAEQYFNTCTRLLNGTTRQPNAAGTGFVTGCSNPAWAIRASDTLRTIPFRLDGLREPSPPQFDMSFNKSFIFTEEVRAQVRFEVFNVANTPIFRGPDMNPNNTSFGRRSLGIANFPRQIQLGLKLYF